MKYYLSIKQKPTGPYTVEELLAKGLTPTSLVWNDDMDDWKKARDVKELAIALGLAEPEVKPEPTPEPVAQPEVKPEPTPEPVAQATVVMGTPVVTPPVQPAPQQAYQQPTPQPYQQVPQQSYQQPATQAYQQAPQQAMVQAPYVNKTGAILSIILGALCCCNIVSMVLGIIALSTGSNVNKLFQSGLVADADQEARKANRLVNIALIMLIVWGIIAFAIPTLSNPELMDSFNAIFE